MAKIDIAALISAETERRLAEMEKPDYEYPPRAAAWNWWAIVAAVGVSVVLVGLCMTGVIQ